MESDIEYVDLGLSVKWAKYNLGATSSEVYGGFYAWGETEARLNFDWSYKFLREYVTPWYFTKYCNDPEKGTVDNLVVLEACDDAATAKLGKGWRIPTATEWKELVDNCSWVWTDGFNPSNVPGFLIISKVPGFEDKSIFLPALGYMTDAHRQDRELGYYWTSNLFEDDCDNALCLKIFDDDKEFWGTPRCLRGYQIRAVHE